MFGQVTQWQQELSHIKNINLQCEFQEQMLKDLCDASSADAYIVAYLKDQKVREVDHIVLREALRLNQAHNVDVGKWFTGHHLRMWLSSQTQKMQRCPVLWLRGTRMFKFHGRLTANKSKWVQKRLP